jgi:iron(III) transport system permease protein
VIGAGLINRRSVTIGLGFGVFALFAWAPLAVWLAVALSAPSSDAWRLAVPDGRRLQVLGETVLYALAAATFAALIGSSAALYCWRRDNSLARAAEWIGLLALPFPPYLHALAWMPLLAALPARGVGWGSACWVQTLAMAPFAFGAARLAMERLDPRWIEAARVYGDDRRLMLRVLLPALAPSILAGFSLVLLLTLVDPSAPSLFSCSSYALEIFADFSAHHDSARAMWISTPLILAGLFALHPLRACWRNLAQRLSEPFLRRRR